MSLIGIEINLNSINNNEYDIKKYQNNIKCDGEINFYYNNNIIKYNKKLINKSFLPIVIIIDKKKNNHNIKNKKKYRENIKLFNNNHIEKNNKNDKINNKLNNKKDINNKEINTKEDIYTTNNDDDLKEINVKIHNCYYNDEILYIENNSYYFSISSTNSNLLNTPTSSLSLSLSSSSSSSSSINSITSSPPINYPSSLFPTSTILKTKKNTISNNFNNKDERTLMKNYPITNFFKIKLDLYTWKYKYNEEIKRNTLLYTFFTSSSSPFSSSSSPPYISSSFPLSTQPYYYSLSNNVSNEEFRRNSILVFLILFFLYFIISISKFILLRQKDIHLKIKN